MTERPTVSDRGAFADVGDLDDLDENLLRRYASVLRRRVWWLVLGLVAGLAAGVLSAVLVAKPGPTVHYFKATNTLAMGSAGAGSLSTDSGNTTLQQALLVSQSSDLINRVGKAMKMPYAQVVKQVSAVASTNSNLPAIDVTAVATDPKIAVQLANETAMSIAEMTGAATQNKMQSDRAAAQAQIDSLNKQHDALVAQIAADPANAAALQAQLSDLSSQIENAKSQLQSLPKPGSAGTLQTLQPALPIEINARGYSNRTTQNLNARSPQSTGPTASNPDFSETDLSHAGPIPKTTRIAAGAMAGLVMGLLGAFLIEAWDDRLRHRDAVERMTRLPVLAEIPQMRKEQARAHRLAVIDEASGPAAERVRAARTAIQFALDAHEATAGRTPVLLVTSPGPSEGKTTTAANLATSFADAGLQVLVIDGDFRRPTMRRFLAPTPNLVAPDDPMETRVKGVRFLAGPYGSTHPDEAVSELRMMVDRWRSEFDLVVLDTPPILATNDASDLLAVADSVVLVLRSGQTRKGPARRVASMLARYRADVLGVVLNGCNRREMDSYYGGYGYGYRKHRDEGDAEFDGLAKAEARAAVPADADAAANADANVVVDADVVEASGARRSGGVGGPNRSFDAGQGRDSVRSADESDALDTEHSSGAETSQGSEPHDGSANSGKTDDGLIDWSAPDD